MAKNLILCQFCEISKEIKLKCFTCDLLLCENCADKHSKFSGSEEHCIIDLKKAKKPENVDIIRQSNLKSIQCTTHNGEKCSLFCKDCKKPICSFCVLEPEHKGHNIEKISTVYNNQLFVLKGIKATIEKNLPDINTGVRECSSTIDNYNEIKQKIIQREREIKERATAEAEVLINELDKLVKPNIDALVKEKQNIQDIECKLEKKKEEIDTVLQSHQATCVLATFDKVDKHLPLKINLDNTTPKQKFRFIVPNSPSINFGSVTKGPILKVIHTYVTNVPFIHNLKSFKDGTLVSIFRKKDHYRDFIGYSNDQGKKHIINNEICLPMFVRSPRDMTVTDDDMILITNGTGEIRCLNAYNEKFKYFKFDRRFSNDEQFKHFNYKRRFSFISSDINGIHSNGHTILVGLSDFHTSKNHPSDIYIMVLNKEEECLKKSWNTETKHNALSPPNKTYQIEKLTKNINGDINIIDKEKVIVFDYNFRLKWTYEKLHSPNDIVTTSYGQIVVSDNVSIHLLSMDGDLLTTIGEQEGINNPTCLHIDKNGQLLVVCNGEESDDAKIIVVKMLCLSPKRVKSVWAIFGPDY
ncbi:unnamed protein product [Mytilus coruscus]|uniref:B box-type domain-containing protein n=1 Tax=Mytilus coruscus TaxID=42192 RepID=A0A6J8DKZ6_MYTCO|nr:unnamed protein product [Mytilus coruscus]